MAAYFVVLLGSVLLGVGTIAIRGAFITLALRTAGLLDALLDPDADELRKQRKLIAAAGSEIRALLRFLAMLSIVLLCAVLPVLLHARYTSTSMDLSHLGTGWGLAALAVGTTLPFVLFSWRRKKEDYGEWSKLLHRMVLDHYHIGRYLFKLDRRKNGGAPDGPIPGPVMVSGLARSGTTALTTLLVKSPAFHSLTYANMPFLLAPNIWRRFYKPRTGVVRERSHGDKVLFSYTSVEALEEYFFKVFLHDGYIAADHLQEHAIDAAVHEEYRAYQNMLRPASRPASVYLAKNNNMILRYRSLRAHDPGSKVVWLFRDPVGHAFSLMKQHMRFSALQEKDPFVREYMDWLGHHEFGSGQKPFRFADGTQAPPGDRNAIEYWLGVWTAYYERLLALIDDDALLVDYADLLHDPQGLIDRIAAYTGLPIEVGPIDPFENVNTYVGPMEEGTLRKANEVFARLTVRARSGTRADVSVQ